MKKIKLFCLLIIAFQLAIISCKKESQELTLKKENKLSDKEILKLFSKIGSQHNTALSNVLSRLKELKDKRLFIGFQRGGNSSQIELETYDTIINSVTRDAIQNFIYLSPDSLYTTEIIKTYVFGYHFGQIDTTYNHKFLEDVSISSTLDNLINNINEIIQSSNSKEETISSLQILLENGLSTLTDENEKMAFVSGIEIGKSSTEYWYSNISDWIEIYPDFGKNDKSFNGYSARQTTSQIIKDAIFDDVKGGVFGTIRGAIKGSIFGVHSAAAAGLFNGFVGGVSASAGSGLWGAIKIWLGW